MAPRVWGTTSTVTDPSKPYVEAIQALLDEKAKERGYDNIFTAISYLDDENEKYAGEAAALKSWRSAVWTYSNAELDKVMTGMRDQPTLESFIDELPNFSWDQ